MIVRYAALIAVIFPLVCSANELAQRKAITSRADALFVHEQFDTLDRLVDRYRRTGARTSSGLWKLTFLYGGIEDGTDTDKHDVRYWQRREEIARRWIARSPRSAAAYICYSLLLMRHAWSIRGSGWAYQVRPQDWAPFYRYVRKARLNLERHKRIGETDPRWYEAMLQVARAEGWGINRFDALVNEATAKYPYFYQIYFRAVIYLLPKWYGSPRQVEAFARFALDRTREHEGSGLYARIYWYLSQIQYSNRLFVESDVRWPEMKQGIHDVLARYPDQWNINNFARFACLAGDRQETLALVDRIKGQPIVDAWGDRALFDRCRDWANNAAL